jgi:hypothetical protein
LELLLPLLYHESSYAISRIPNGYTYIYLIFSYQLKKHGAFFSISTSFDESSSSTKHELESIFNEPVEDSEILGVLPYVRGFILKESNSSTIAFKGTDRLSDWVSNIYVTKISVSWLDNYNPIPQAHKGFTNAYNVIRNYNYESTTTM